MWQNFKPLAVNVHNEQRPPEIESCNDVTSAVKVVISLGQQRAR